MAEKRAGGAASNDRQLAKRKATSMAKKKKTKSATRTRREARLVEVLFRMTYGKAIPVLPAELVQFTTEEEAMLNVFRRVAAVTWDNDLGRMADALSGVHENGLPVWNGRYSFYTESRFAYTDPGTILGCRARAHADAQKKETSE